MANGVTIPVPGWVSFVGTLVLTVAASIGSMYTTFETQSDHDTDNLRIERKLELMDGKLDKLLMRTLPFQRMPSLPPKDEDQSVPEARRRLDELLQYRHRNNVAKVG